MKILNYALYCVLLTTVSVLPGCKGSNTKIDGVDGPKAVYQNNVISISMIFKNLSIDAGASIPIPKYPNSSFQIAPDLQSGGTLLSLSISVPDYLNVGGAGLDPQALPGGRPLPGVDGGALPAIAVKIPALNNSVLYVGPDVIGLFVPFRVNTNGAIITSRFYNDDGDRIGNLSLVGADANGENSGILLLMDPTLIGIHGDEARFNRLQYLYDQGYL